MLYFEAASFNVGYTTAYHCLVERAAVQKGEWVLVHGATGIINNSNTKRAIAIAPSNTCFTTS